MASFLILAAVFGLAFLILQGWRGERLRRISAERIGLQTNEDPDQFDSPPVDLPRYPRRYYYAAPLAALVLGSIVYFGTSLPIPYAVGTAVLAGALTYLLEVFWADKRIERMESQLADAIDLMVASLRAGSALPAALDATCREARQPMREELETMVGRIRVGEDPKVVVQELARRVPLESFRLFSHTLLVHWETGGSLSSSLRTVGRTVRDRLEVSRRISAQAVESQISVVAVMGITYGLSAFMYNNNPGPFKKLLYSQLGAYSSCGLMILQAVGMFWIWRMSRIRF